MDKLIAIILKEDTSARMISAQPAYAHELMGQPQIDYVRKAVSFADEVIEAEAGELTGNLAGDGDWVILAWADMPLMSEADYRDLAATARSLGDQPAALGDAACWPGKLLRETLKEEREAALSYGPRLEIQREPVTLRLTTRALIAQGQAYLRAQINAAHMEKGVSMVDPEAVYIEPGVMIGQDTVIYPGCYLQRGTVIGRGCTLLPNSRLKGARIGEGVTIESSVLIDCGIGDHTTVGPFAYVRPQTVVGQDCRIGDFVELKNSHIGSGTKVSHLTYVGDSDLGEHINLGCGVVFVNYDGKTKQRSVVEDHAFIGCNTNLVAPVHVGKEAYVAAGATITEDVPAGALYIARARGAIKEGWVQKRKDSGKL